MPMNYADYPPNWKQISFEVIYRRAQLRCEWPECRAVQGQPHPDTGSIVILTTAHLCDCRPKCGNLDHLRASCQRCHLNYDRPHHLRKQAINRRHKRIDAGQLPMLDDDGAYSAALNLECTDEDPASHKERTV